MARPSRTQFAVLGMLSAGPRSGYDLKKDLEHRVGHFWTESVGQIYPALRRLRDGGFVRVRRSRGDHQDRGRPARTVYTITDKGRASLQAWLELPAARETVRDELLLKVFFGPDAGIETVLSQLDRFETTQLALRERFRDLEDEIDEAGSSETELFWRLTLNAGQHMNRARLAWCREARRMLEAHAGATDAVPARR